MNIHDIVCVGETNDAFTNTVKNYFLYTYNYRVQSFHVAIDQKFCFRIDLDILIRSLNIEFY